VSVPIFVVRFVSDHGKEHILLCVFAGARQTIFVTRFIFWRTKKSVCCTFYFLEGQTNFFFFPHRGGIRPLAFVVHHRVKAHGKDVLFVVCFLPAHGKHIPLLCILFWHKANIYLYRVFS
jgi:hypothetical protein